jgi:dienelactone hydrolase
MTSSSKFSGRALLGRRRPSASFPLARQPGARGLIPDGFGPEGLAAALWLLALAVACTAHQPEFVEPDSPLPANDNGTPAAAPSAGRSAVVEPTSEVAATRGGSDDGTPTPQRGAATPMRSGTPDDQDEVDAEGSSSGSNVGDGAGDDPGPSASGDEGGAEGNGSVEALIRGGDPTLDSATNAGPFEVDTLSAGLRDGPDYGTQTLHYPTDAEPPFAAVAVVPGFTAPESSIRSWGPFLASHGIVALTIGTNSPTDSPDARADALLDALETIKAENTRSIGPLAGKIDVTRLGVMGWSMGGGGTLITANAHPELKAAITLAAWSPGERFSTDRVPTLLFAGSSDTLAGGQSQGFFASIPTTTPKMMYEVDGGSHSVANNPNGAGGEVGRYGLSWLKVFLDGDERYRQFLLVPPSRDSEFLQNLTDGF